jgi:creatinine amidohydrolase
MGKAKEILHMTRDEVAKAITSFPVAILPLGATEQHGHHLPLGTDIFLAEGISRKLSEKTGALLLPTLSFGYSWFGGISLVHYPCNNITLKPL